MSNTKGKSLIKEATVRRWGRLANMAPLTETFLEDHTALFEDEDAMDDEMGAADDEMAAGEAEMEAGAEAAESVGEEETVERIVAAVVDAISSETGVDIEVDGSAGDEGAMDDMDAGMDASDAMDDMADDDMDDADDAMMRDPYNRRDLEEGGMKKGDQSKSRADYSGNKDKDAKEDKKEREAYDKKSKDSGARKGDQSKSKADFEESLDLEVIDDEALTEAVLHRVVERLLKKN